MCGLSDKVRGEWRRLLDEELCGLLNHMIRVIE
jgi:hypothetical protein